MRSGSTGDRNDQDDLVAFDPALISASYDEIHTLASTLINRERWDHTLQATALINEAYLILRKRFGSNMVPQSKFLQIAAWAMRRVLVDHARTSNTQKRGGNVQTIALNSATSDDVPEIDLVELDDVLTHFANTDRRAAKVVEMRYFGGLTVEQTAKALDVSKRTVEKDWTWARAWLQKSLQ